MNKKTRIIAIIMGVILLLVVIFLSLFFNRKFEVRFYLDNGANVGTVQVKYNKMINEEDIKGKDVLGESFINWYEIIEAKDGKDVLADKPFDFKTKVTKDIKLKAVFDETNKLD